MRFTGKRGGLEAAKKKLKQLEEDDLENDLETMQSSGRKLSWDSLENNAGGDLDELPSRSIPTQQPGPLVRRTITLSMKAMKGMRL